METQATTGQPQKSAPQPQAAGQPPLSGEPPLQETLTQAVDSVSILYRRTQSVLQKQAEEAPYVALAAAAAVGFVIGGGLASPLGQRLLRLTFRQFGPPLLQTLLDVSKESQPESSTAADL